MFLTRYFWCFFEYILALALSHWLHFDDDSIVTKNLCTCVLSYDDRITLSLLFVFFVLLFGGGWELSKLQESLICGGRYPSWTLFVYRIGRVLLAYICSVYSNHNCVICIYVLYIKSVHLINSIVGFFSLRCGILCCILYFVI